MKFAHSIKDTSVTCVQKIEKVNVSKYMFLVSYEDGRKKISNYYGSFEQYIKSHPSCNIVEFYIFDKLTPPTSQDFYDIFGHYPTTNLSWLESAIYDYTKTESFTLDGKKDDEIPESKVSSVTVNHKSYKSSDICGDFAIISSIQDKPIERVSNLTDATNRAIEKCKKEKTTFKVFALEELIDVQNEMKSGQGVKILNKTDYDTK